MAQGPDGRKRVRLIDEGVVLGHAPVIAHAVDLAVRLIEPLHGSLPGLHAEAQEDMAGPVEADASTRGHVGGRVVERLVDLEDGLLVRPRSVAQPAADKLGHRRWSASTLGGAVFAAVAVAEIDPAVVRVVGMQGHVENPAVAVLKRAELYGAAVPDGRTGHQLRLLAGGGDDREPAHLLGEQDAAIRQGGDGVGERVKPIGDEFEAEVVQRRPHCIRGHDQRCLDAEVAEGRVGAFLGDEDGDTPDLGLRQRLRPTGHAPVRHPGGDAPGDVVDAVAVAQIDAHQRRALGSALKVPPVAYGAMTVVEALEALDLLDPACRDAEQQNTARQPVDCEWRHCPATPRRSLMPTDIRGA